MVKELVYRLPVEEAMGFNYSLGLPIYEENSEGLWELACFVFGEETVDKRGLGCCVDMMRSFDLCWETWGEKIKPYCDDAKNMWMDIRAKELVDNVLTMNLRIAECWRSHPRTRRLSFEVVERLDVVGKFGFDGPGRSRLLVGEMTGLTWFRGSPWITTPVAVGVLETDEGEKHLLYDSKMFIKVALGLYPLEGVEKAGLVVLVREENLPPGTVRELLEMGRGKVGGS